MSLGPGSELARVFETDAKRSFERGRGYPTLTSAELRRPSARLTDVRPLVHVTVLLVALLVAACSVGDGIRAARSNDVGAGGRGASTCAFVVRFQDRSYNGLTVAVEPAPGRSLGEAILPGCADTGRDASTPDQRIGVAELPGVDPKIAMVWSDNPDTVLVGADVNPLPAEVAKLMHPPPCEVADAPIRLEGPWLGIIGADGKTELDLLPPYDLEMLVTRASARRYERAHLTVRVPVELGSPLTHDDITTSLWKPGTLAVTAVCDGPRFVAEQVAAFPSG